MDNPGRDEHTVAWFGSTADAHKAVLSLERHGIDSTFIQISHTPRPEERRTADKNSFAWLAKLGAIGLVAGAALGALIGVVVGAIMGANQLTFVAIVIAGAFIGGALLGLGIYAVKMPVSTESYDMLSGETSGDDWVAVSGPIDLRDKARDVLEELHPVKVAG